MSKCPEITGLTFSLSGQRAVEAIRAKQNLANVLAGIMAVTPLVGIFGSKGALHPPLAIGWKIAKNDWEQWAQTMGAIPLIVREEVINIAARQYQDGALSGQEREFWFAVANGCER